MKTLWISLCVGIFFYFIGPLIIVGTSIVWDLFWQPTIELLLSGASPSSDKP
jgi:hypothetical protein